MNLENDLDLNKFSSSSCDVNDELTKNKSILQIKDEDLNTKINFNTNINYLEISELSTCPLCLERLDTSASGITSIKTTSCLTILKRWKNYKKHCAVCSKLNLFNKNSIKQQAKKINLSEKGNIENFDLLIDIPNKEEKIATQEKDNHINNINNKHAKKEKSNESIINIIKDSKLNNNLIKCINCGTQNNLWICLICGAIGCDRYYLGHAVEHFQLTYHRYSMDMTHERIWDYKDDKWVHRVLKISDINENNNSLTYLDSESNNNESNNRNETDYNLINLEDDNNGNSNEENLNTKEFLMRIENIICEYNFVLSEQLEQQRIYYENEMEKITEKKDEIINNKLNEVNTLHDQLKELTEINEKDKKMIKEYNKKLTQQEKKMDEIEENKILTLEMIKNLKEDVQSLKEKNVNTLFKKIY